MQEYAREHLIHPDLGSQSELLFENQIFPRRDIGGNGRIIVSRVGRAQGIKYRVDGAGHSPYFCIRRPTRVAMLQVPVPREKIVGPVPRTREPMMIVMTRSVTHHHKEAG